MRNKNTKSRLAALLRSSNAGSAPLFIYERDDLYQEVITLGESKVVYIKITELSISNRDRTGI